jgi:hypothetical protein
MDRLLVCKEIKEMSKKKKANKKIRDKYSMTLKEMEDEGLVPKDFHLFDSIEMKEYQAQFDGYKEWERKIKEREDKAGPNAGLGV